MKILVSAMALAIALAWPTTGEAQSKKSNLRKATATHQKHVSRPTAVARTRAATPCVGRTWQGCVGWDPDPLIRQSLWDTHNGGP